MADSNESANIKKVENETSGSVAVNTSPQASHSSGKSENLEDLFKTLKQQIANSDWLEKNSSDKWVQDNPELAKEYMEAAKQS